MARSPYEVPCHAGVRNPPHVRCTTWKHLTSGRGKPNAEPKTMPRRASQPSPNLAGLGRRSKGFEMRGPQTAAIGLLIIELGINRKAMILDVTAN